MRYKKCFSVKNGIIFIGKPLWRKICSGFFFTFKKICDIVVVKGMYVRCSNMHYMHITTGNGLYLVENRYILCIYKEEG